MSKFDFVLYQNKGKGGTSPNVFSINKSGKILVSKQFMVEQGIKGFNYVQMYYDKKNLAVAMQFSSHKVDNAFKLGINSLFINSGKFFQNLGIKPAVKEYEWSKQDEEDGKNIYYIISLK